MRDPVTIKFVRACPPHRVGDVEIVSQEAAWSLMRTGRAVVAPADLAALAPVLRRQPAIETGMAGDAPEMAVTRRFYRVPGRPAPAVEATVDPSGASPDAVAVATTEGQEG